MKVDEPNITVRFVDCVIKKAMTCSLQHEVLDLNAHVPWSGFAISATN